MKLECSHADTCLPSFWSGSSTPHIQVPVYHGMTFGELKSALDLELLTGAMGGEALPDDDKKWYDAANAAIKAMTLTDPAGTDETRLFTHLEVTDPDDDCSESVYAFFVFTEVE